MGRLTLLHLAVLHTSKGDGCFSVGQGRCGQCEEQHGHHSFAEAAQNGNKEIAEILLAHGTNINALDEKGCGFERIPCVGRRANGRNSESKPFLRKRHPLGEFIFSKPNSGVVNKRLT
ncbi:MAG: hypothetical protein DME22_14780 [Verrucomicrobia bacterium]|nr:MAG: hypothetical protein DME22_14780 [Verrucomicrobiota bacterium]PYJ96062.1 MAG: hypothetical protein DME23_21790 [Verrucomicrobiota bacterium]